LRREFELYKRRHPELTGAREAAVVEAPVAVSELDVRRPVEAGVATEDREAEGRDPVGAVAAEENAIYFRPGMTMEELERAAIIATLESVAGNRRRASEQLGIGERTLYRKLKEYDIDA
jgi:DNA-binding NtrC family response regulator